MTNDELYYRRSQEIIADVTANYHNKRLTTVDEIKAKFIDLMSDVLVFSTQPRSEFKRTVIDMEKALDELLEPDWEMSSDIVGTSASMLMSKYLIDWKARRKQAVEPSIMFEDVLKSNRVITNPATYSDIGESI